ncbi:hypothetical protein FHS85_003187 [Rhodoligotrophos appendicifer]
MAISEAARREKRHQQNAPWIGAAYDEMSDAMCQGIGLARAGPGDDEKRSSRGHTLGINPMLDCSSLLGIEPFEICQGF